MNLQPEPAVQPGEVNRNLESMNDMMERMHGTGQEANPPLPNRPEPPHFPAPVFNSEPNASGIHGLNENISEWGLKPVQRSGVMKKGKMEYVILGGLGSGLEKGPSVSAPLSRKPWEGFEELGFRTVRSRGAQD